MQHLKSRMKKIKIFNFITLILLLSSCGEETTDTNKGNQKTKEGFTYQPQNIEILLENSASNFGYLTKNTVFKKTLSKLITDIRSKELSKNLGIGYANGERYCKGNIFSKSEEIKTFLENLNPSFLEKVQCPTNSSDMVKVIMNSLPDTNFSMKWVFSDFIFSIPKDHSLENLSFQKDFMKEIFSNYLKNNSHLGLAVIKFSSEFEGTYYSESTNQMIPNVNGKRPFYIFMMGNHKDLNHILTQLNFQDYEGFENLLFYFPAQDVKKPKARLQNNKIKGDITIEGSPADLTFKNNAYEGELEFSFKIDLSNLNIPEFMIQDTSLYQLNHGFVIKKIQKLEKDESNYTHSFTIAHKNFKPKYENCTISFELQLPQWVEESNSEDDKNPVSDEQSQKTFGFKYLIQGILEAYNNINQSSKIYELNIQFKD